MEKKENYVLHLDFGTESTWNFSQCQKQYHVSSLLTSKCTATKHLNENITEITIVSSSYNFISTFPYNII
jgi:hypothetical protein